MGFLTLLCAAVVAAYAATFPLNHDLAWWLYIAKGLLQGEVLYRDLIEINPPLMAYLSMPAIGLSNSLGLDLTVVAKGLILLLALLTASWAARLLCRASEAGLRAETVFLLLFIPALVLAGEDLGQREHLMWSLATPFLVVSSLRVLGNQTSSKSALVAGVLAGVGFCLKPHFLAIWLGMAVWAAIRSRSLAALKGEVEIVASGIVMAVYLGLVVLLFPDYTQLLGETIHLYSDFARQSVFNVSRRPTTLLLVVMLGTLFFVRRRHTLPLLVPELVIFGGLTWLVAVVQLKGWSYHFLPSTVSLVTAAAFVVIALTGRAGGRPLHRRPADLSTTFLLLVTMSLVVVSVSRLQVAKGRVQQAKIESISGVLTRYDASSILILSDRVSDAFPLVTYSKARWASPYPTLWWIQAVHSDWGRAVRTTPGHAGSPAPKDSVERRLTDRLLEHAERASPDMILVDTSRTSRFGSVAFPYLEYFQHYRRFQSFIGEYTQVEELGRFVVYRRITNGRKA